MNVCGRCRGQQARESHVQTQRPEDSVKFDICGARAGRGVGGIFVGAAQI